MTATFTRSTAGDTPDYRAFLERKSYRAPSSGLDVAAGDIHPRLFPFQRDLVRWALRKGRAALFADTGLGKTLMQLEWARLTGQRTLILAPLAVAQQTIHEAAVIGLTVAYAYDQSGVGPGITITNYERLDKFDPAAFGAVVLDESSILKALDGVTRKRLTEVFATTPWRLCCTATPAPNDIAEIGNHAEFLGIMRQSEMLSAYFVTDQDALGKQGWRLKGHARQAFFRWLASWSMALLLPSDLGYSDEGYILPPLDIRPEFVPTDYVPEGQLFFGGLKGITDRSRVRRSTLTDRCDRAAALINGNADQWIVWHGLNDEGHLLQRLIPGSVLVEGSQSLDEKVAGIARFQSGEARVLITKPRIAGHGLNLQRTHRMAFVGLSDSWESYYQCIRRCWRFGQTAPVEVAIVLSDAEAAIYENVMRKEEEATTMRTDLIAQAAEMEREELAGDTPPEDYRTATVAEAGWTMMLGDSCERLAEVADGSVGLSVFSPPFASLFTYSPSDRDLGNSRTRAEFFDQFSFIIRELLRVTMPGRHAVIHVQQIATTVVHDGVTAMTDFRGECIRAFMAEGWYFHGEVTIDKDPQAQAIRTKAKGLLFVQKARDRSWLRPAMADFMIVMRKPGDNPTPILTDQISNDEWIEWARPIWYGIRESATLNAAEARDEKDEKHIAALQLETLRRTIRLWSNTDDLILDPFAGIGSTGYVAIQNERRFVGCELKPSYFRAALKNLRAADGRLTLGLTA